MVTQPDVQTVNSTPRDSGQRRKVADAQARERRNPGAPGSAAARPRHARELVELRPGVDHAAVVEPGRAPPNGASTESASMVATPPSPTRTFLSVVVVHERDPLPVGREVRVGHTLGARNGLGVELLPALDPQPADLRLSRPRHDAGAAVRRDRERREQRCWRQSVSPNVTYSSSRRSRGPRPSARPTQPPPAPAARAPTARAASARARRPADPRRSAAARPSRLPSSCRAAPAPPRTARP